MNKKFVILVFFMTLVAFALLAGIIIIRPPSPPPDQLVVAATIFPLADITRQIAGPHAQVVQLIPSNSTAHSFNLTPQQIRQLTYVVTTFAIGHGLDQRVTDAALKVIDNDRGANAAFKTMPYSTIIVDQNITLRAFGPSLENSDQADSDHIDSNEDPHYWLTVPNAQAIASTIAQELIRIDPAHTADYHTNLTTYLLSLDQLEQELQRLSAKATQRNFIAVHDAWSYFAAQYGLSLVATYEPLEGRTPTINDLQRLQQLIKQYQIQSFYTEPQKTTSAGIRLMQQEFGLKIMTIDPTGGIDPHDSYIDLMLRNMQAITAAN
jgi:zinc transport system substrate-binding protein